MSDTSRILNLDQIVTVAVTLQGREFQIKQDRRAVIERVLAEASAELETTDEKTENSRTLTQTLFANADNSLPTISLIFGFEKETDEKREILEFLSEYLRPDAAIQIFQTWWEINRIDDFFLRGGKTVMPPYVVRMLENPEAEFAN